MLQQILGHLLQNWMHSYYNFYKGNISADFGTFTKGLNALWEQVDTTMVFFSRYWDINYNFKCSLKITTTMVTFQQILWHSLQNWSRFKNNYYNGYISANFWTLATKLNALINPIR